MQSFKNHFLIATPSLSTGIFHESVVLVCEHDDQGAMGVIINQPSSHSLAEVLGSIEFEDQPETFIDLEKEPVLIGGPVGTERGFVLHSNTDAITYRSTLNVGDNFSVTGSRDILQDIALHQGPDSYLLALGYAGWSSGQLEQEIVENSWLIAEADEEIIFNTPNELKAKAIATKMGFDLAALSSCSGSA